jgi:hypothetical protein
LLLPQFFEIGEDGTPAAAESACQVTMVDGQTTGIAAGLQAEIRG